MNSTSENPKDDAEPNTEATPALRQAFKQLAPPRVEVPASTDAALFGAARAHLARPRTNRVWRVAPYAAAACVALVFTLSMIIHQPGSASVGSGGAGGTGADILPALALARELEAGVQPAAIWDANGDGAITFADVDTFAHRATALPAIAPRPVPTDPGRAPGEARFETISLYVDSDGRPLAAFQLRFHALAGSGTIKVVGVENGDSPAYKNRAPYFDQSAIDEGRAEQIVIAGLSTAGAAELPRGKTRVATVHVMIESGNPQFEVQLNVAADADGQKISAGTWIQKGTR